MMARTETHFDFTVDVRPFMEAMDKAAKAATTLYGSLCVAAAAMDNRPMYRRPGHPWHSRSWYASTSVR